MDAAPLIQLEDVTKTYAMGDVEVQALRGVSLSIGRGEFSAIMGASGSGKSTLMNVLGCLDRPTRGRYLLDGRDVSGLPAEQLAEIRNRTIGFVFQSFNLLSRTTALENVELPLLYAGLGNAERHARAAEALARVGLGDRVHHHPSQLSGGQQQRVAIARALVNQPRVLLADEPTGNLDSRTSAEVMALLQDLGRAGITVVLVTHEPDIAEHASRIIVMRDGKIRSDERRTPRPAVPRPLEEDDELEPGRAAP
jgi:putative ABC transport system ATP-binding protein